MRSRRSPESELVVGTGAVNKVITAARLAQSVGGGDLLQRVVAPRCVTAGLAESVALPDRLLHIHPPAGHRLAKFMIEGNHSEIVVVAGLVAVTPTVVEAKEEVRIVVPKRLLEAAHVGSRQLVVASRPVPVEPHAIPAKLLRRCDQFADAVLQGFSLAEIGADPPTAGIHECFVIELPVRLVKREIVPVKQVIGVKRAAGMAPLVQVEPVGMAADQFPALVVHRGMLAIGDRLDAMMFAGGHHRLNVGGLLPAGALAADPLLGLRRHVAPVIRRPEDLLPPIHILGPHLQHAGGNPFGIDQARMTGHYRGSAYRHRPQAVADIEHIAFDVHKLLPLPEFDPCFVTILFLTASEWEINDHLLPRRHGHIPFTGRPDGVQVMHQRQNQFAGHRLVARVAHGNRHRARFTSPIEQFVGEYLYNTHASGFRSSRLCVNGDEQDAGEQ